MLSEPILVSNIESWPWAPEKKRGYLMCYLAPSHLAEPKNPTLLYLLSLQKRRLAMVRSRMAFRGPLLAFVATIVAFYFSNDMTTFPHDLIG